MVGKSVHRPTRHSTLVATLGVTLLVSVPPWTQATAQRMAVASGPANAAPTNGEKGTKATRAVSVHATNALVRDVVKTIAQQAGLDISYVDVIPEQARVTLNADGIPASEAFRLALYPAGFTAEVRETGNVLIFLATRTADAGVIVGKVIDAKTKRPIGGVTVVLGQATRGVQTSEDGGFRIPNVPAGSHTLTFRLIGYVKQTVTVTVSEGQTATADVVLEASASPLSEVIVTGTVVETERKAIPNPITVITAAELEKKGITRIEQLFRGSVPGIIALEKGSGTFGTELGTMQKADVYARGSSRLYTSATPLKTFIDGVELLDASYLGTIDPQSIERIEIVTGPQAATIYGSGAMGGVMQIFTKRGNGKGVPELTLNVKAGLMETNISPARTPMHQHGLTLTGGSGPAFSYSGTASHDYQGQWQPGTYFRTFGGSAGVNLVQGPTTISGSLSLTSGENGTIDSDGWINGGLSWYNNLATGEWTSTYWGKRTKKTANSQSQTLALNVDYRAASWWQHHVTAGRGRTGFSLKSFEPVFLTPSDSLYSVQTSDGQRTTLGYNMTMMSPSVGLVTATMTLGANGSWSEGSTLTACAGTKTSTTYVACDQYNPVNAGRLEPTRSWGGFGTVRFGLAERLFLTLGMRGETNRAYGRDHRIDWTPTNGITYTIERDQFTLKLLASYGRATRQPESYMKDDAYSSYEGYEPSTYVYQLANPNLTPEYSRGPQGGFELYIGDRATLTVNRYSQQITDLITSINGVDSIPRIRVYDGQVVWIKQGMYANVGSVSQTGWESTGSLNLGPLALSGTYSWTYGRITALKPPATGWTVGETPVGLPPHTGNITATYAHGGSTFTLVTNYIGRSMQWSHYAMGYFDANNARLKQYLSNIRTLRESNRRIDKIGYMKSDFVGSQRLTSSITATINITNLGNRFTSDVPAVLPTLGRQTLLGVQIRYPKR